MKRADKARKIQAILEEFYPEVQVPLDHRDPYTLLVAVLLSAQCTDERVNRTTPALFARARTPKAMATLDEDEIRALIRPCGLSPQKAKAIRGLSSQIALQHAGQVPRTFEELEALPGVGHKTASVVMAQAFGIPAFPVDTHIHRLAARWGLSDGRSVERTERDIKALFAIETWNKLHLQIIYFGREHCPALRHDLEACAICSWAASAKQKRAEATRAARPRTRAARGA